MTIDYKCSGWRKSIIALIAFLAFYVVTAPPLVWLNHQYRYVPVPIRGTALGTALQAYCFPPEFVIEFWEDSQRDHSGEYWVDHDDDPMPPVDQQ